MTIHKTLYFLAFIFISSSSYAEDKDNEFLCKSIIQGNLNGVKILLEKSAYPSINDKICKDKMIKLTPIELAVHKVQKDIVEFLLLHSSFNQEKQINFYTFLIKKSLKNEWWLIVNKLLVYKLYKKEANLNYNIENETAIVYAFNNNQKFSEAKEIVKIMDPLIKEFKPDERLAKQIVSIFGSLNPSPEEGIVLLKQLTTWILEPEKHKHIFQDMTAFFVNEQSNFIDLIEFLSCGYHYAKIKPEELIQLIEKWFNSIGIHEFLLPCVKKIYNEFFKIKGKDFNSGHRARVKYILKYRDFIFDDTAITSFLYRSKDINTIFRFIAHVKDFPQLSVDIRRKAIIQNSIKNSKDFVLLMKPNADEEKPLIKNLIKISLNPLKKLKPSLIDINKIIDQIDKEDKEFKHLFNQIISENDRKIFTAIKTKSNIFKHTMPIIEVNKKLDNKAATTISPKVEPKNLDQN